MKTIPVVTFDASAKTITFDSSFDVEQKRISIITNVTDGIIIYNFASPVKGGTLVGDVLTLDYDTTTMDDTDVIRVDYDDDDVTNGVSLGTLQNSAVAVGTGTAVDVTGIDYAALNVRGITSAVVTFQASIDGTNYDDILAQTMGGFVISPTTIANGNYLVNVAGYKYLRANITSYSSGTITITATSHKGTAFNMGFFYKINPEKNIDADNGLARVQKKYTYNPAGAPLRGTSLYASGSAAISIKSSPGVLFALQAHHINATVTYFQLHDRASAPAATNVPIFSVPLAQYEKLRLTESDLTELGLVFATGIACGFSSTKDTFTALGTPTDCFAMWRYM